MVFSQDPREASPNISSKYPKKKSYYGINLSSPHHFLAPYCYKFVLVRILEMTNVVLHRIVYVQKVLN